jgi:uncharacterized membrane protein
MKGGLAMLISLLDGLELHNPNVFIFKSISTIVFYFTVYSFLGWLLENSYNFLTERKFFKSNLFWGPFKPMYGFAPVLLLLFINKNTHWALIVFLCFLIPTLVEYLSGYFLQKLFKRQWWDYSMMPLHIKGHICLPFSLCWVLLSLICLKWIHPAIVFLYGVVEPLWSWIWPTVCLYFLAELLLAIRRHSPEGLLPGENTNTIQ